MYHDGIERSETSKWEVVLPGKDLFVRTGKVWWRSENQQSELIGHIQLSAHLEMARAARTRLTFVTRRPT